MAIVDASSVPEMPANPTALLAAAAAMTPAAASVRERTADAVTRWSTLGDSFDTPDTGTVVGRAQPLVAIADDFESAASAVADAIRTLGETLASLERTRAQLAAEVDAHITSVGRHRASEVNAVEIESDTLEGMDAENWAQGEALKRRCDELGAQFRAALDECEQELRRVGDAVVTLPSSPAGVSEDWRDRASDFADAVSMSILGRLAVSSSEEVRSLLLDNPGWAKLVYEYPPHADHVAMWWEALDGNTRTALTSCASWIIGNLDGVSYAFRDRANRATLASEIGRVRQEIQDAKTRPAAGWEPGYGVGGSKSTQLVLLEDRLSTLLNIERALTPLPGGALRSLTSFTADKPPLAAVSIGNLDDATSVSYAVPGMGTTSRDMTGWTTGAQNIFDEQVRVTNDADRAVVAWIGYKTPPVPIAQGGFGVLSTSAAEVGAVHLDRALDGLQAARNDTVQLNVIGHSYGTTTSTFALADPHAPRVDTFVSVGSAGLPPSIDTAARLNAVEVYAGQAPNVVPILQASEGDQWAWTGRMSPAHPVDPTSPGFGAQVFGVDGSDGNHPVTDHGTHVSEGEGWGYFDPGTQSLRNIALATTGHGDLVSPSSPEDTGRIKSRFSR